VALWGLSGLWPWCLLWLISVGSVSFLCQCLWSGLCAPLSHSGAPWLSGHSTLGTADPSEALPCLLPSPKVSLTSRYHRHHCRSTSS
jgi:hypothetical protein